MLTGEIELSLWVGKDDHLWKLSSPAMVTNVFMGEDDHFEQG